MAADTPDFSGTPIVGASIPNIGGGVQVVTAQPNINAGQNLSLIAGVVGKIINLLKVVISDKSTQTATAMALEDGVGRVYLRWYAQPSMNLLADLNNVAMVAGTGLQVNNADVVNMGAAEQLTVFYTQV